MTSIQSVGNYNSKNLPVPVENGVKTNYRVSFKNNSNDRYTPNNRTTLPQNMVNPQQMQMIRMMEAQQKEQKKQKVKQNLSWGLGIGASLVLILALLPQSLAFFKKGGAGAGLPGAFKIDNLNFENLTGSKKLGNLRETKTYTQKVKDFFIDLLDNANIDEKALKKAGFLDEALPNAALVLGPPGVGKTEIIKMFSKSLGGEYCEVKLGEVANSFVDGTATQILKMFEELVKKAKENPNVNYTIFFDEIDGFARKLGSISSHNEYLGKNRQSFIKGLDMLKELKNVRIFGASNVPIEEIDEAVVSRLAKNITIDLPRKTEALEGLKFHLRNVDVGNFYEKQGDLLDDFMENLCNKKCSFRDIGTIVTDARAKFAKDVSKTKDYDLNFDIQYLERALQEKGLTSGELVTV